MKKILIVEDDQIVANQFRSKFLVEGFEVETAADGLAGLGMVRTFRPDVIILDLVLPKMTGLELLKKIRSEPDFQHLPVVVFSSTYLSSMIQEAWKAGATKCLAKANCSAKELIEVVRSALSPKARSAVAPPSRVAAAAPPPKPAAPTGTNLASSRATANDPDVEFQAGLRNSLIKGLPSALATLRSLLQALSRAGNDMTRLEQLHELYRRIHTLTGNAGIAGLPSIARVSDALEALLKELHEKPRNITPSTLRTVASAIDFLGLLFDQGKAQENLENPPPNVLVVDDDAISRRAVTYALQIAKLKSVSLDDPAVAYDLLAKSKFDLIFLDVDMPSMSGFDLCTKLRQLPAHKNTPVVFVTHLNDFESRANSPISGGDELITKPFLFIEMAVKALVWVLRARLQAAK
jgi:CheY-like chemotaxis protein